jgi:lysophospholipase L1-like esterase
VILASVLPATNFEWRKSVGNRSAMIVALNKRLKAYSETNKITFIDYHSVMKNEQNGMNPEIAADGVHPTMKGFKMMEEIVEKALMTK